jgi:hypothetical protein
VVSVASCSLRGCVILKEVISVHDSDRLIDNGGQESHWHLLHLHILSVCGHRRRCSARSSADPVGDAGALAYKSIWRSKRTLVGARCASGAQRWRYLGAVCGMRIDMEGGWVYGGWMWWW